MSTNLTAEQRIKRAMINLMRTDPFFSTILLKMNFTETDMVETMCTNGKRIVYNPKFVDELKRDECEVVLCHESCHVAFGHHVRQGDREGQPWNIACDLAINSMLKDRRGFSKDYGCLAGSREFKDWPEDKSAEWYYTKVLQEFQRQPAGQGGDGKGQGEGDGKGSAGRANKDSQSQKQRSRSSGTDSSNGEADETSTDASDKNSQGQGETTQKSGSSGDDGQRTSSRRSRDRERNSDGSASDSDQRSTEEAADRSGDQEDRAMGEKSRSFKSDSGGMMGDVEPYPLAEGESQAQAEADWQTTIAQAMVEAKSAGNMPAKLAEMITEMLGVSQVPWKLALRPFLSKTCRGGWTYRKPNKKKLWQSDVIFPSNKRRSLGKIMLACDTSGSMSQEEMNKLLPELESILREFRKAKLDVIEFDAKVQWRQEFTQIDLPIKVKKWEWHGRGGTEYKPVFDLVKKERPRALIMLTDGYPCDGFGEDIGIPTLWLMTQDIKSPWGQNVMMK